MAKRRQFEGYGLQPIHTIGESNRALAPEGNREYKFTNILPSRPLAAHGRSISLTVQRGLRQAAQRQRYTLSMSAPNSSPESNSKPGWFSRLPRKTQALLLALLMFAISAGAFLLGIHELHSGMKVTVTAGTSDWSDDFFWSAFTFLLGAALLAVAVGWKPENSKIKLPK